jgi:hypothetical protein
MDFRSHGCSTEAIPEAPFFSLSLRKRELSCLHGVALCRESRLQKVRGRRGRVREGWLIAPFCSRLEWLIIKGIGEGSKIRRIPRPFVEGCAVFSITGVDVQIWIEQKSYRHDSTTGLQL